MKIRDQAALLRQFPQLGHFGTDVPAVLELRAGGAAVSTAQRDDLLARARDGQYVELEVDFLAYEQKPGEMNRRFIRFEPGAIQNLGRTGVGTPFLRDHETDDVNARAGTVIASKTEKLGEGHYEIRQTAKVTAPWAVDAILRGNLDRVSIGARPTGPINCSLCKAAIGSKPECWGHYPGARFTERADSTGKRYLVRAADGDRVVEWIFTAAELAETSGVSVPAVAAAEMEGIRAALSAHEPDNGGAGGFDMDLHARLISILSLGASASPDEVVNAVEARLKKLNATEVELKLVEAQRVELAAKVEEHNKIERKNTLEKFIADARATGRLELNDPHEAMWRDMFEADPAKAAARMADIPANSATPVGAKPQSAEPEPGASAAGGVNAAFTAHGQDANAVFSLARAMGAENPEAVAARLLNIKPGA